MNFFYQIINIIIIIIRNQLFLFLQQTLLQCGTVRIAVIALLAKRHFAPICEPTNLRRKKRNHQGRRGNTRRRKRFRRNRFPRKILSLLHLSARCILACCVPLYLEYKVHWCLTSWHTLRSFLLELRRMLFTPAHCWWFCLHLNLSKLMKDRH